MEVLGSLKLPMCNQKVLVKVIRLREVGREIEILSPWIT